MVAGVEKRCGDVHNRRLPDDPRDADVIEYSSVPTQFPAEHWGRSRARFLGGGGPIFEGSTSRYPGRQSPDLSEVQPSGMDPVRRAPMPPPSDYVLSVSLVRYPSTAIVSLMARRFESSELEKHRCRQGRGRYPAWTIQGRSEGVRGRDSNQQPTTGLLHLGGPIMTIYRRRAIYSNFLHIADPVIIRPVALLAVFFILMILCSAIL